jgi:phage/plasmid-associated DNA primase
MGTEARIGGFAFRKDIATWRTSVKQQTSKVEPVQQKPTRNMNVKEFCDKHELPYVTMVVYIKPDGKKGGVCTPTGWKEWSYEKCMERNSWTENRDNTHMLINLKNTPFMVVDEDREDGHDERFDGLPYSFSTRGKRHYWHRVKDSDPRRQFVGEGDGTDYIYEHILERIDTPVHGDWLNLPTFDFQKYNATIPLKVSTPNTPVPQTSEFKQPKSNNQAIEQARNIAGSEIDNYRQWLAFISACANCGVPESVCREVSSRGVKYRSSTDDKTIASIYSRGSWRAGMGTLCYLSKLSDKDNFYRIQSKYFWMDASEEEFIGKEWNDTAYARAFLKLHSHTIGFDKMQGLVCYVDETGLWATGKAAEAHIRNQICDTLQRLLRNRMAIENDNDKLKLYVKMINKMGQNKQRQCFFSCVKDLAYQMCKTFNIDRETGTEHWFAFADCIYDANTGTQLPYFPEAYLSQRLHYNCPTIEPKKTDLLRKISSQIFPDEVERDLYLTCLAYGLTGETAWEMHVNSNGKSGAGKSLFVKDLASNAFKIYHSTWNPKIFMRETAGRRKKWFTTALTRPIRFTTIEEMEIKDFDEECFKEWTSGGCISVDTDYAIEATENISMVTCFSLTNNPLALNNIKGINRDRLDALKRRIKFFNMKSRFVTEEQVERVKSEGGVDPANVFVKDVKFKDNFPKDVSMHEAFAWLMMEQWKKLSSNDWKPPNFDILDSQLADHMEENQIIDPVHRWLRESYEADAESWTSLEDIVMAYDDGKKTTKADMREAILQVFGGSLDGEPMYKKDKRMNGSRGCVRLKVRSGFVILSE